jgi:hypothetical protein
MGSIMISLLQSVDCIIAHHLGHLVGAHYLCACNYLGFDVVFIVASTMLPDLLRFFYYSCINPITFIVLANNVFM